MKKIIEIIVGIFLVIIGLVGGVIPILPGWILGIPGLILLSKHFPIAKNIFNKLRTIIKK